MNRECMICMEDSSVFVTFQCGHEVCRQCYPKVMHANPECPLCRRQLLPMLPPTPTNDCNCFYGALAFMFVVMVVYLVYGVAFFSKRRS
jgi:hypothetical protein